MSNDPCGRNEIVQIHELVAYRLNALSNSVLRSAARQYMQQTGLHPPEAWVLCAIGDFQPATAREVANRMDIDEAQVSRAIKALVEQGHVTRRPDKNDNRQKLLTLSPTGRRLSKRVMQLAEARQVALLEGFTDQDLKSFVGHLRRMSQNSRSLLARS